VVVTSFVVSSVGVGHVRTAATNASTRPWCKCSSGDWIQARAGAPCPRQAWNALRAPRPQMVLGLAHIEDLAEARRQSGEEPVNHRGEPEGPVPQHDDLLGLLQVNGLPRGPDFLGEALPIAHGDDVASLGRVGLSEARPRRGEVTPPRGGGGVGELDPEPDAVRAANSSPPAR
jgi:hypothetical protein